MTEGLLRTYLLTFPSITSVFDKKIYTGNIPEGIKDPSVCIYRISDVISYIDEIETLVVQVSNFGSVYSDVEAQSKLLYERLKGFRGFMGNTDISSIVAGNGNLLYDSTLKRWQHIQDYTIVIIK